MTEQHDSDEGGQVSEVSAMDPSAADTPISDDQAVAGNPDGESGEVQEGRTGPNARTGSEHEPDTDPTTPRD
jgi:hypothetical protein